MRKKVTPRKLRPTVEEVRYLEAKLQRCGRTNSRFRAWVKTLEARVDNLEARLRAYCAEPVEMEPHKAAPWELPRVRTPGGLLVGSD